MTTSRCFERMALPVVSGGTKIAGIKIHDNRIMRLMEVLLNCGTQLYGWQGVDIHPAILTTFGLSTSTHSLTHLRYDSRKVETPRPARTLGRPTATGLTDKSVKAALMFILLHKRICGPQADSFHHRPDETLKPGTKIEAAYTALITPSNAYSICSQPETSERREFSDWRMLQTRSDAEERATV